MGTTNINGQQVTINISDSIPPDNIATIDKGTLVGNTKSKEQLEVWQTEVEDKVDKISTSAIKGEATPTSSPTPYNATDYPKGLYEKWEIKTAGTYTNFKDAANAPIVVSSTDLEKKLVYINVTNGVSKLDITGIPGAAIATDFNITNTDKAQSAFTINDFLVNKVKGGESEELSSTVEQVGAFYKNIGVTTDGSSPDGLTAGLYSVKTNAISIADASKFMTKAFIKLSTAGAFKFCIGTWNSATNIFTIRWTSDQKTGVVGWNNYSFQEKIFTGEMAAVLCLDNTTAQISFGGSGVAGNMFLQYSTTGATPGQGASGSFYSLYFELKDIDLVNVPSSAMFNLEKSVSKITEKFATNGYSGQEFIKGDSSQVSADSDANSGYAINKIDLATTSLLSKLEIRTITAGVYNIAIGFIEQSGKFIEKLIITKTLTAGINIININPVVINIGDYVGFKFPSKYPVNNNPTVASLWSSNSYTTALTQVAGKSLPIKLFLREYVESPIATKADITTVNSSILGIKQNFINNGKQVKLIFNPNNTVSWEYVEGYSKILHLGNSILRHAIMSYWWSDCGMAAKTKADDYAHRFLAKMKTIKPSAQSWEQNIAAWELDPTGYNKSQLDTLLTSQAYDLIVIRLGENATAIAPATYKTAFRDLVNYIQSKVPTARIVIGGMFWANAGLDNGMQQIAVEKNLAYADMSGLDISTNKSFIGDIVQGDDGQSHAVDNAGVANHPNNNGMEAIASRLFNALSL